MSDALDDLASPPAGIVRCDACPVLCRIREGQTGACDRYANQNGALVRLDPLLIATRSATLVPFLKDAAKWDGDVVRPEAQFVTGIGAGTTYPDYKPAPFIVSSEAEGVDMVTVVTEGIFSYCGVKVKIDTDRYLGPEQANVLCEGEPIGHVTTAEYGSQMLSIGGVRHLTGGSKREGTVTCQALLDLCSAKPVTLSVEGGARVVVQAGRAPIIDDKAEERMRVGCGSAAMGMFAKQWQSLADEVIVVDDHITGVMSEHQAGRFLDVPATGIRVRGRKSTPGRYFKVAEPGMGWGGTNITNPLDIIEKIDPKVAWPGLRLLMVSTTGEDAEWFVLDEARRPVRADMPPSVRASVERVAENCEPALCSVLFMAGAGGSLRAGVTENPVRLTRAVRRAISRVTAGGAPVYLWPGGGITFMVDVTRLPAGAFGYVPTPAIVAPIEFTLPRADYEALGGHVGHIVPLRKVLAEARIKSTALDDANPWPVSVSRS
ncbi:MAG: 6-hydroxynicotinate reductase [Alphaproteobacteria bacterium]|nr:6-hydroxynicotinate reductase [Alphaproteobacteria bacterium]